MKRLFTLIAAVSIIFVAMAQRPLVTLSHNGELSFFSSLSAFEEALDSAVNGDILYLSEGKFTSNATTITIDKRISIVGCGYKSHILADLTMGMKGDTTTNQSIDLTLFDGVRLQKVYFGQRPARLNATISKSWIKEIDDGGYAGTNLLVDRCYIETANFDGASNCNVYVQNSKIWNIAMDNGSYIQVINCNINYCYYCPKVVISSIIVKGSNSNGTLLGISNINSVIYNSWLGYKPTSSYITTYGCYYGYPEGTTMLDDKLETTADLKEKGYLGEDGTVVGVYGGDFPFSENPSVPTVDSSKSSVEYDAENNKLNVTITVSPN